MRLRVAALFALLALAGCGAQPPAYDVVEPPSGAGGPSLVVVEVDQALDEAGYRAVVDDVRGRFGDDGGYLVQVNCATGDTAAADVRLANGRYAVGQLGAAQTGLDAGDVEVDITGQPCP